MAINHQREIIKRLVKNKSLPTSFASYSAYQTGDLLCVLQLGLIAFVTETHTKNVLGESFQINAISFHDGMEITENHNNLTKKIYFLSNPERSMTVDSVNGLDNELKNINRLVEFIYSVYPKIRLVEQIQSEQEFIAGLKKGIEELNNSYTALTTLEAELKK